MKDTDLYSRILGLSTHGLLLTSSWTRQEAAWMSMLSTQLVSDGTARPVGTSWLVRIMPGLGCGVTVGTVSSRHSILARVPRVECPEHGVLQVKVPWVEAKGRFTCSWSA